MQQDNDSEWVKKKKSQHQDLKRAVQSTEQYKHSGEALFTYLFLIFSFLRFHILEENSMDSSSFLDPRKRSF